MNMRQIALIKKDIRSIVSNKQLFGSMLAVPLVLTVVLPSIFVFITILVPDAKTEFQTMLDMLPVEIQDGNIEQLILGLIFNKIMPMFFLIISLMASTIMSASSFVGEKEKNTLENLLYSPLSIYQLFQAKIMASFFVAMLTSVISFVAMMVVIELEVFCMMKEWLIPDISWLPVMILVAPAVSLIGIALTVRSSAKAQTIEEAQQRAVFLIFPILALMIGQFTGVILINSWLLWGIGIVFAVAAWLLMRGIVGKFSYESLLQ